MKQYMDQMIEFGMMVPNPSATFTSPAFPIRKPNVTLTAPLLERYRLTVDFRQLNEHTREIMYPLPILDTLPERIGGSSWFATLDLQSGYYQIPLHEDSQDAFSIRTDAGVFKPLRLVPGCRNGAASFQCCMTEVLGDLIGKCVEVYIDDVIVHEKTEDVLRQGVLS